MRHIQLSHGWHAHSLCEAGGSCFEDLLDHPMQLIMVMLCMVIDCLMFSQQSLTGHVTIMHA